MGVLHDWVHQYFDKQGSLKGCSAGAPVTQAIMKYFGLFFVSSRHLKNSKVT